MGDILRDAALDLGFERNGELAGHALELGNLAVGESRGPIAQPRTEDAVLSRRVEADQEQDIVGAAQGPQFLERLEVEERRLTGQPAPQERQAVGQHMAEGAAHEPLAFGAVIGLVELDHGAAAGIPAHDAGVVERMEDPEGDLAAQDRQADAAQALAQLAIKRTRFGIVQRLAGQPFEGGVA